MKQATLYDDAPAFTNRRTDAVTFRGKMGLPIHRWYRLTPSFSPHLANDIADHFKLGRNDLVLDPFSGVGTVPLCMKYRGIPACSIELNPYLHFVSSVKTRTYDDVDAIEKVFERFVRMYRQAIALLPNGSSTKALLRDNWRYVPPISHPERWWSPGNLVQLTVLRKLILEQNNEQEHLDLLKMGILGILVPVSNAKHNHVSLTFAEKPLATVDVADILESKYCEIVEDLRAVGHLQHASVTVFSGNSKNVSRILPEVTRVTAVITSPPYPNRFSYARETRPHLFFFNFISSPGAVGKLETEAIGGTWGKATSVLADGVLPANETVRSLLDPYMRGIKHECRIMSGYITKYFNDMYAHAREMAKVCTSNAPLAYVIGNSKFFDHPLPSDEILASLFAAHGIKLDRIDRMRKRQSKSGLYEAVVFMRAS